MTESKKNKVKQWIPVSMLEDANHDNWLQSLAYFIMLKSKYQNQTIYAYKPKKIADLLGISYNTACYHLNVLEQKGLIKRHCGNLTLLGVEKQKKLFLNEKKFVSKLLTSILIAKDKKTQIDNIRAAIVILNLRRQSYVHNKKSETLHYSSCPIKGNITKSEYEKMKYCYKKVQKEGGSQKFAKTINKSVMMSNHKFGDTFGLSKYTGARIQKSMRKRGFIKSKPNYERFQDCANLFAFRHSYLPSKYFYNDKFKCIYYQTANVIELLPSNTSINNPTSK